MTRASRRVAIAGVVALVVAAIATLVTTERAEKIVTAYFRETPGLYAGDPVRVLGVDIGTIESITVEPHQVKVVMHYDKSVQIPAEARAAIISPTMVSGRFVQLAPAYIEGPELAEDATIPLDRTATPVEWDRTVEELTKLATQLGPQAGEVTGALGRALDTAQANLGGQGDLIHDTIRNASAAVATLAAGGEDLFGTVGHLQSIAANLAQNDQAVAAFSRQLAQVSTTLDSNRDQLATVVRTLDESAVLIENFVRDHRDQLNTTVVDLAKVAKSLAGSRQAFATLMQRAPVGVSNLNNIYDPPSSSMTGGFALTNLSDPATFVCSLIFAAGGKTENTTKLCEAAIAPFVQILKMNNIPLLTSPLEVPPVDVPQVQGGGR
jgi:phospholipid/cholesterol/gamma-HCH transport system substrate-binding protein